MRVVMVSKALVVGNYQHLAVEIGRRGVELTVLCPPSWQDSRGQHPLERLPSTEFRLQAMPIRWNGHYHLHHYPGLGQQLRALKPDLVHLDEEPYNLATFQGLRWAHRQGIPAMWVTWQNLDRRYPPPFRWFERYAYRTANHALACTQEAEQVVRAKGYKGALTVTPLMGVDSRLFFPGPKPIAKTPFSIGYAGGLLPEKGVDILLQACTELDGDWRLHIAGGGQEESHLRQLAEKLDITSSIQWWGRQSSRDMPGFYRQLHVLVLPSRTRPNWKEQFGRVLIEAMACGVPAVVSDSGACQQVVGSAGLVYPEADPRALAHHLQSLNDSNPLRQELGQVALQRVRDSFEMGTVAARIVDVYHQMHMA